MGPWATVAAGIAALDITLVRRGRPTLSAHWWAALEQPTARPLPVGVWTCVTYHLMRPRRTWTEAIGVGAAGALSVFLTVHVGGHRGTR